MKTLIRITGVFAAALIFAVVLTTATVSPRRAYAGCGSDVTWQIEAELFGRQTLDTVSGRTTYTQQYSDGSTHRSDNGQESTHLQTHQTNADGSSTGHSEFTYSDSQGKGCNSEGKPVKASTRNDDDTDSEGNRKEHHEELIIKDGKCELYVRDREWDRNGKLIKETESKTEVPCGKYSLQVVMKGHVSLSGSEMTYGPNAVLIPLEDKGDNTHEGSYEGQFNVTLFGECNGIGTYPVTFDVTAKEDEFESMDITVKTSIGFSFAGSCGEASGSGGMPPVTGAPLTFTLPAEEGASKVYSMPVGGSGNLSISFILRRNPQ